MRELPIIGNHAFYALEGATIDGLTVGGTAATKPDNDPIENWSSLGVIEEARYAPQFEGETTHYAPAPGGYKRRRTTYESVSLQINLVCQDMDELLFSLALAAKAPAVDGVFVPGSLTEPRRGWIKIQQYIAEDDQLVNLMDLWCELRVEDLTTNRSVVKPSLRLDLLDSDGNTGQLSNWTAGS